MKQKKEMNTNHLIALCYILDDFEEFKEKLTNFISLKYNRDIISKLDKVSREEGCFNKKKPRAFIKKIRK